MARVRSFDFKTINAQMKKVVRNLSVTAKNNKATKDTLVEIGKELRRGKAIITRLEKRFRVPKLRPVSLKKLVEQAERVIIGKKRRVRQTPRH